MMLGAAAAALLAVQPPLPAPAPPSPVLGAFVRGVIFGCLTAQERHAPLAELPAPYQTDFVVAPEDSPVLRLVHDPKATVWISRSAGSGVWLVEKSPGRCEVWSIGLPVAETEDRVAAGLNALAPPYVAVPARRSTGDIAREFVRAAPDGRAVKVHLEGSEPGAFGHLSRQSMLAAIVTSHPAAVPPTSDRR